MFLSKRSNGNYYIFYDRANGKRTCISTKTKIKTEALIFLSEFKDNLRKRSLLDVIPKTLLEFTYEFSRYSESIHRPKTTKQFNSILKEFRKYCSNIYLHEIDSNIVQHYLQKKSKVSVYTSQKHLAYLRSAFNKALSKNYIVKNPFDKIDNYKLPEKLPLFFDEISFGKLINVIVDDAIKNIVLFAVNTGLRLMELITLSWTQINLEKKYLMLDNIGYLTKSKRSRSIPLNTTAIEVLQRMQVKNGLVFSVNGNQIKPDWLSKRFKKYVRAAGVNSNLNFHSLRHTFASWLVQRGVSIYIVSKLLGHADIKTTQIYSHLRTEDLRSSIELISFKLSNPLQK